MADDSLDDELLAAVGRSSGGGGSSRKPPSSRASAKRGRNDLTSDDEDYDDEPSEFKRDTDDDDDDGEDSEVDKGGASSGRKAPGSKMPLKKRLDKDDDDASGDGYDTDLSYGSDLYKDDDDKEWLGKMSELDREMILLDRGERRDTFLTRKQGATRLKKDVGSGISERGKMKDHQTPASSSRMRSSTREFSTSSKKHALDKLVSARRQKDHDFDQRRNSARKASPIRRDESDDDSVPDGDSADDEDESHRTHRTQKEGKSADAEDPTLEDVSTITIRRSKLAKWFLEPFFEEIIVGCFVRVGVGVKDNLSCYRLCQVKNVDARDPSKQYKFENRMTHKWLNLVWGDSEARWQMARISDQPPVEAEFQQWEKEVKKSQSRNAKPSLGDITEKREAIAKLSSFVYSADCVKKMLHEKKMSASRPPNVAAEKDRLLKELALKDNHVDIERIQAKLKELEAYSKQIESKNKKALALADMNKRNRFENFKNASELKPVSHAKAGEAGYDPFSRRWTRSQNYYDRSSRARDAEAAKEVEAATAAAREAAADAGKLTDTRAPVEDNKVFSLHDFHLPISLAGIQKFGGAQGAHLAFIARKQRLEATCGVPVENSDGRRHMLTLTVNDYKRRRGLL